LVDRASAIGEEAEPATTDNSREELDPRSAERIARLLRWYPTNWRERYGDEFAAVLASSLSDGKGSLRLSMNVAREGMVARLEEAGFVGWLATDPGSRDSHQSGPERAQAQATSALNKSEAGRTYQQAVPEDGFGLLASDETVSAAGFSAWVRRLISAGDSCTTDDPTVSRCIYRWIVDGDDVLGGIALRYGDSEFIRSAGHIGYGMRPSARRRGFATLALGHIPNEAGAHSASTACFLSAMPATWPLPPRSNAMGECSRASNKPSTA
jgi:predicted acetyltransferase